MIQKGTEKRGKASLLWTITVNRGNQFLRFFFFLRKCFKEMSHYRFACSFFNQYILELFPYVLAHVDVLYYFRWTHNHHDD